VVVGSAGEAGRVPPPSAESPDLEQRILAMLESRSRASTICPSDVAREASPDEWRPLMEPVRQAARRLMDRGAVEITQHGEVIDPATARGPIRIRLPRRDS
jgi:hypothetical protein